MFPCPEQRNGANQVVAIECAPKVSSRRNIGCFYVEQIWLIFQRDSNLEFILLNRQNQIDDISTVKVVEGPDADFCGFRNRRHCNQYKYYSLVFVYKYT